MKGALSAYGVQRKELIMPPGYVKPYAMPPRPAPDHPTLGLRLRVWWKKEELDTALANGADPTESPELTLRARQLVEPKRRETLAQEIYSLLAVAERPRDPLQVAFRASQVRANRSLLLELAARLRDHGPHALRGLAMTSRLLRDSRGPLYPGNGPRTLERAVGDALSALEPEPLPTASPPDRASRRVGGNRTH
jgi:hypothetical protein